MAQAQTALAQYESVRAQLNLLERVRLPEALEASQSALRAYAGNHLTLAATLRYARSVTHEDLARWTLAAQGASAQAQLDYFATRLEYRHAR